MFRKIRNRILLLNMAMVSSVVIIAFIVIFTTTYSQVLSENRDKLLFGLPIRQIPILDGDFRQEGVFHAEHRIDGTSVAGFSRRISPDAGLSFSILVDSENSVIEVNSMVDLSSDTYARMATQAMGDSGSAETITSEDRVWQYVVTPVTFVFTETFGTGALSTTVTGEYSHIRFLDVTDSYRTIRSLALLLSVLTLVILAVFFFISRFFANRAVRPMKEAWEKQSRFVTDASHELRTPLSVIGASCGVLYAGKDEAVGTQLKWVDNIMRATDRMTGLVSGLLTLANIDDTQLVLKNEPLDLSAVVSDAVSDIEALSLEKDLTIHRKIDPGVKIESDREHIRKVLSILLDNAAKYTDFGGEVTVSLKTEKHHVIFAVRNSGEGIPAEDLPRLFDRFYRGDPARSSENSGYGLGLAIAKAITTQMGAALSVESVLDEYTEFTLVFELDNYS